MRVLEKLNIVHPAPTCILTDSQLSTHSGVLPDDQSPLTIQTDELDADLTRPPPPYHATSDPDVRINASQLHVSATDTGYKPSTGAKIQLISPSPLYYMTMVTTYPNIIEQRSNFLEQRLLLKSKTRVLQRPTGHLKNSAMEKMIA